MVPMLGCYNKFNFIYMHVLELLCSRSNIAIKVHQNVWFCTHLVTTFLMLIDDHRKIKYWKIKIKKDDKYFKFEWNKIIPIIIAIVFNVTVVSISALINVSKHPFDMGHPLVSFEYNHKKTGVGLIWPLPWPVPEQK